MPSDSSRSPRYSWSVLIRRESFWLGLALFLRLAWAWKLGNGFYQADEVGFHGTAANLALHGVIGTGETRKIMPPIPCAFFALFYLIRPYALFARLGQAFVSAATACLIGRMTNDLTGSVPAGRLALAVSAVYPFFIYYSGLLMTETLYLAFAVAGLWFLSASLRDAGAPGKAAISGLALGLAALCRTEGAYIAAVIWAAAGAACLAGRWSWKNLAAGVLAWLLPLAAWSARNQAAAGAFTLDTHGGKTLLIGTEFFDQNEIDTSLAARALELLPFYRETLALPEVERDRVYKRRAFEFLRANPGEAARQSARKFVNFWRLFPRTDKTPATHKDVSGASAGMSRSLMVATSLAFEPLLILGGFWGLWLLRERGATLFPLALFLLGTMGIHILVVSQMRYRLPVMPLLILGAAYAAARRLEAKLS